MILTKQFSKFLDFLNKNNILNSILATILSTYVTDFSSSFINNLIIPIINRDNNNDDLPDINKYEDYILNLYGIKFKIGKFFIDFLKFLIICFFIYLITQFNLN